MVSRQQIATIAYSFYVNHLDNIHKKIDALSKDVFDPTVSLSAVKTSIQHARYLRILVMRLTGMTYRQIGTYHGNSTATNMMSLAHKGYRIVCRNLLRNHPRIARALVSYTEGQIPVLVNVKDKVILDDIARLAHYSECLQDYYSMRRELGTPEALVYVNHVAAKLNDVPPTHHAVSSLLCRDMGIRPKTITGRVSMEMIANTLGLHVKGQKHAVALEKHFPELTARIKMRQWDDITLDDAVKFISYVTTGRANSKAQLSVNLQFADGITVTSNSAR